MTPNEAINNIIDKLKQKTKNLAPVLSVVSALIQSAIDDNFEQQGRFNGNMLGINLFSGGQERWAPLAESTKRDYERKGWVLEPTLRRSSAGLYSTISVENIGNNIQISANAPYSSFLQHGTKYMPARPFITLTESDVDNIVSYFAKYITD